MWVLRSSCVPWTDNNRKQNHMFMKLNNKHEQYLSPEVAIFAVKMEGVICESPLLSSFIILGQGGAPEISYPEWTEEDI